MLALELYTDPAETLGRLLERLLPALRPGARVLVKPEWWARDERRASENTSPEFLRALVAWLEGRGAKVSIAHSSLLTPPDVPYLSFSDLIKENGVNFLLEDHPHVGLIDLETEPAELRRSGDVALLAPITLREHDVFVACVRPKTHMGTTVALGTKGLMGLLPDSENLRMHRDGLDELLGHLGRACAPTITLVEGDIGMEGDGPHHGDDVPLGWYLGGDDLLETDCAAAALMGFAPEEVGHLAALARLSARPVPALPTELRPLVRKLRPSGAFLQHTRRVRVWPGDSCATCHMAASSVQDLVRANPQRVGDVAALASMLYVKGFNIFMGHQSAPPPGGEACVAVGDCTREWAERYGVPRVGGCPVRVHEVGPALLTVLHRLNRGEESP